MSLTLVPSLNPPPPKLNPSPPGRRVLRHVEGAEAIAGSVEDVVVLAEVVHAVGVVAEEPRGADTRTRMVCCLSMS
jgi:hypothetical protein